MTELTECSAEGLTELYSQREVSPVEVVEAFLERIADQDSAICAFVQVLPESALASARRAEKRWKDGTARRLEGVPFAVKDLIATAGVPTAGGSRIYENAVPSSTATACQRLLDVGAVLTGKLMTTEFGLSVLGNAHFDPVRNPWDRSRTPGGSSSGPGAALAARLVPLALGTDTGGSIRIPAALCGVCGLKPTFGRVSRKGVMPLSWSLDHVGPMARSVTDLATALEIIAGPDTADPSCSTRAPTQYRAELDADLSDIRIGVPRQWFFDSCAPEVRLATDRAAEVLEASGAGVIDISLPNAHLGPGIGLTLILAEMTALHSDKRNRLDELDPEVGGALVVGREIAAEDYLRAQQLRRLIQEDFSRAFATVDLILTPAIPIAAPPIGATEVLLHGESLSIDELILRNTSPVNAAGVPALVIPSGSIDNLPVGIQLIAPPYAEALCLRAGKAFQRATDHHRRRPPDC